MRCGPRLPVESIVTSTLSAFSFLIVVVLVRSGQTPSITASLEVSFTKRRLQPLSIFCIVFCCSSRLSVQTSTVGIGLPEVLALDSSISAFHCPFCMPLNIFGINTSSAATAAAKPSAQTAAILTAWFMAASPRFSWAYCSLDHRANVPVCADRTLSEHLHGRYAGLGIWTSYGF